MSQGRGSAVVVAAAAVVWWLLVINNEVAQAATTYKVGDASGWTLNMVAWPKGKRFRAGDILVFNYSPQAHNVGVVNKAGYDTCKAPAGAKLFSSGKDQVKLVKGQNYFICTFPGHCQSGMKIAITAV